jgi:apolipoprotein N-acyltransferase
MFRFEAMIKKIGLAVLSALLLSLAWPARGVPILLFISLVPLFVLEHSIRKDDRRFKGTRFMLLTWLGFGLWNLATTWWIWNSTQPGAVVAIVCNAMFMAIVWRLYYFTRSVFGAQRGYAGLIFFWLSFEYLHLDWDLSWPWLMLGNGFAGWHFLIQWYEWTGVQGGTLWVLVSNIIVWEFIVLPGMERRRKAYFFPVIIVLLPCVISLVRYATWEDRGDKIGAAGIQPNIDPYQEKFRVSAEEQVEKLVYWSEAAVRQHPDIRVIVYPETSVPRAIWEHDLPKHPSLNPFSEWLQDKPDLGLILGIYSLRQIPPGEKIPISATQDRGGYWRDDHNSALYLDRSGRFDVYHKSKLVPGPEMLPFAELLAPVQDVMFGELGGLIGNMGRQSYRSVFRITDSEAIAAPIVCYESIYGEFVGDYVKAGANFLAVLTNDAWWGETAGHRQLLAYTKLRAIETRRSVIRSANTGISCTINQRGDVQNTLGYLQEGFVYGEISLNSHKTLYVKFGDFFGGISLLLSAMLLLYGLVYRRLKK